jgi:hypothetical protein
VIYSITAAAFTVSNFGYQAATAQDWTVGSRSLLLPDMCGLRQHWSLPDLVHLLPKAGYVPSRESLSFQRPRNGVEIAHDTEGRQRLGGIQRL